jgi:DnaJ-class molecular chaperone
MSAQEIKAAYRKLSLKHHPDRVKEGDKGEATKRMVEINAANEVLGDEDKRKWYDMYGVVKK